MDTDHGDNIECLYDDLEKVLHHHALENKLSQATTIGVLELVKANYIRDCQENG